MIYCNNKTCKHYTDKDICELKMIHIEVKIDTECCPICLEYEDKYEDKYQKPILYV